MTLLHRALKRQYARTMREAYAFARQAAHVAPGATVLDCGSGAGHEFEATFGGLSDAPRLQYMGLEWDRASVLRGAASGLDIREADLNRALPVESDSVDCAIAYSVVEHLLMPCSFLLECHRVLKPGGRLVVLTPNISTYFTALQVLAGRMPSSGPHPDSNRLVAMEEPCRVTELERDDMAGDTPVHRHLVVFSYRALRRFMEMSGFDVLQARGFGYYPLPMWLQPLFERTDRPHCHQMVLVCGKRP